MGYRNLSACIQDLERTGQLVRIKEEIDPNLEAAAIHRRVYRAGGPAVLYTRLKGTAFPMVSNLFGTIERARFLFRDTLDRVRRLIELKIDPSHLLRRPWRYRIAPFAAWHMRPKPVRSGPVLAHSTSLSSLPQLRPGRSMAVRSSRFPRFTPSIPTRPVGRSSNLGMYRVQLSGNEYELDRECGLHYQIHRGIGIHHAAAVARGEPLAVNVAIGGPPALAIAAVMPLPEGMPELAFAGVLGGRRIPMCRAGNGASHAC